MNNLIIIPARKNSVRLKNKNILKIGNKTLIEHSIIFAKKISTNTNILVSTDSKKIRKISLEKKILCPWLRPKNLSTSKALTEDVVLHALNWFEKKKKLVDFVILLQPTSPFRTKKTFFKCLDKAKKNPKSTVITFKKKKIKIYVAKKNKANLKSIQCIEPNGSIYIISAKKLKKQKFFYAGDVKPQIVINQKENIDIDYKKDYMRAKKLF